MVAADWSLGENTASIESGHPAVLYAVSIANLFSRTAQDDVDFPQSN
jgi:hypothetical protein